LRHFPTEDYVKGLSAGGGPLFGFAESGRFGGTAAWQGAFREKLRNILGLNELAETTAGLPLAPRSAELTVLPGYTREKLYIATETGIEIPFYLLLPREVVGPVPLVLTPHGHGRRGKEVYVGNFEDEEERREALDGERDIAVQAVARGYAAIAMDVRGFWEMAREEDVLARNRDSCDDLHKKALLFGRTLIGERVHDMGRLIDYAATRPEIDAGRIAITGNSGGGTVSLFAAALDPRIRVCVPGSYFCTFAASILSVYHCPCNYIPGVMRLGEMYDIAGLIAPRPFLAVNGKEDELFPAVATVEAYARLSVIYTTLGFADNCALYLGEGGHRYFKAPVWPFINKHLQYFQGVQ